MNITPESVTPKESCLAISKSNKYEIKILIIRITFKIIGAAAAAANYYLNLICLKKKMISLQIIKKGNVILVNSTARLNFKSSAMKPGAIKVNQKRCKYFC